MWLCVACFSPSSLSSFVCPGIIQSSHALQPTRPDQTRADVLGGLGWYCCNHQCWGPQLHWSTVHRLVYMYVCIGYDNMGYVCKWDDITYTTVNTSFCVCISLTCVIMLDSPYSFLLYTLLTCKIDLWVYHLVINKISWLTYFKYVK